jgi:uncharacterized protein YycO
MMKKDIMIRHTNCNSNRKRIVYSCRDQHVEVKQINGKCQENQRVLRMDLDSLMCGLPKEGKNNEYLENFLYKIVNQT